MLQPVSLILRILAFPIILIYIVAHPSLVIRHELRHRYCPDCRRRQTICYGVVGVWSAAFVVLTYLELLKGW